MAESDSITRHAFPAFAILLALGCLGLAMAHGKIPGINFRGLIHLSTVLVLLSGVALMWRAEHQR